MIRTERNKGFTIFIAIALTGTLLLIATSIVNLALKQKRISNAGRDSQAAFYAADSGMECALYWDVKNIDGGGSAFATTSDAIPNYPISCNQDASNPNNHWLVGGTAQSVIQYITFLPSPGCAKVIVTKNPNGSTQVESFGYNTCDLTSSQRVERAVRANYGGEVADPVLSIFKYGNGSGTVTSNVGGISCGAVCSATFPKGTIVDLTAAFDPGKTFAGWSAPGGICSGTGGCRVTMDASLGVGATFYSPGSFSPDAGATLPNSLVAYWKMDEASGNRADSKGSNTLTDVNTVMSTAGKKSNAAWFTAANAEYLSSPDTPALSIGSSSFTLAGWVNLGSKANYRAIVHKIGEFYVGYDPNVDRFGFYLYGDAGRIGYVQADNFGSPAVGPWYFLVIDYNLTTDTMSISVNNGAANTAIANERAGDPADTANTFRFGTDSSGAPNNYYWEGYMDEWGLWRRTLTAQEKTNLYNGGAGNTFTP